MGVVVGLPELRLFLCSFASRKFHEGSAELAATSVSSMLSYFERPVGDALR
jgi:hypothetical protein